MTSSLPTSPRRAASSRTPMRARCWSPALTPASSCTYRPSTSGRRPGPRQAHPGQSTSGHRAAEASRLVFALDDGTSLPFTLDGVLAILPTLRLLVAAHAVPAGRRGTGPARAQDPTIAQPEPRLLAGSEDLPRFLQATRLARGLVRQVGPPAPPALRGTPPIGPAPARPPLRRRGPRPPTRARRPSRPPTACRSRRVRSAPSCTRWIPSEPRRYPREPALANPPERAGRGCRGQVRRGR